jgi:hypothetical protein
MNISPELAHALIYELFDLLDDDVSVLIPELLHVPTMQFDLVESRSFVRDGRTSYVSVENIRCPLL